MEKKSKDDSITPRTLIEEYFENAPTQRSHLPSRKRKPLERTPLKDDNKRLSRSLPVASSHTAKKRRTSSVATQVTPKTALEDFMVLANSTMPALRRLPHRRSIGTAQSGTETNDILTDTVTPRTRIEGILSQAPEEASVHVVTRSKRLRTSSVHSPTVSVDHTINIQMKSVETTEDEENTETVRSSSRRAQRLASLRHIDMAVSDTASVTSSRVSTGRNSDSSFSSINLNKTVDILMSPARSDVSDRSGYVTRQTPRKAEGLKNQLLRDKFLQGYEKTMRDSYEVLNLRDQSRKDSQAHSPRSTPQKQTPSKSSKLSSLSDNESLAPEASPRKTQRSRSRSSVMSTTLETSNQQEGSRRTSPRKRPSMSPGEPSPWKQTSMTKAGLTDVSKQKSQQGSPMIRSSLRGSSNAEVLSERSNSGVLTPSKTPQSTADGLTPSKSRQLTTPSKTPQSTADGLTPSKSRQLTTPQSTVDALTPSKSRQLTTGGLTPSKSRQSAVNRLTPSKTQEPAADGLTPSRTRRSSVRKSVAGDTQPDGESHVEVDGNTTNIERGRNITSDQNQNSISNIAEGGEDVENNDVENEGVRSHSVNEELRRSDKSGFQQGRKSDGENLVSRTPLQSTYASSSSNQALLTGESNKRSDNLSHVSVRATPQSLVRMKQTTLSSVYKNPNSVQNTSERINTNVSMSWNSIADISAIPSSQEGTPHVTELDTTELFRLKTPHLGPRSSNVPSPLYTSTPAPPKPAARNKVVAEKPMLAPKATSGLLKRPPVPAPKSQFLPNATITQMFKHFCKMRITKDALPEVIRVTDRFFEQMCDDLKALARHAHRNYISQEDVEVLMRRQGFINERVSLNGLIEKYLPLELRQELIPMARSGNKVVP